MNATLISAAGSAHSQQSEPVLRIASFVAAETEALRAFRPCDLVHGSRIKSQALLELTRHARSLRENAIDPALRAAMERLRTALTENQAAIAIHLEAARTLTDMMVDAIERDGSDRTYSRTTARLSAR